MSGTRRRASGERSAVDEGAGEASTIVAHAMALVPTLAELVAARRELGRAAAGPGLGAFIGEADVDAALTGLAARSDADGGRPGGVEALGELFALSPLELFTIVAAAAPQLDARFALLYGYLNDDLSLRALTAGLVLELADLPPWDEQSRWALSSEGRLAAAGLVTTSDAGPFHRRVLSAPDRVVRHLLGRDEVGDDLRRCLAPVVPVASEASGPIVRLFDGEEWFVYLRGPGDLGAPSIAAHAFRQADLDVAHLDLRRRPADVPVAMLLQEVLREAALQYVALIVGPIDAVPADQRSALDAIHRAVVPVVTYGRTGWDPAWCRAMPALVDVPALGLTERRDVWQRALDAAGVDVDATVVASTFHLPPSGIEQAVGAAVVHARSLDRPVDTAAIAHGARSQNGVSLERLARRVVPRARFDDLVLPPSTMARVRDLVEWVRNRDRVLDVFGVRGQGTKGRGVAGLLVGGSGTGKTLSAEVVAGELGLDLYVVDLSTVVSKYIGETEENLERIFTEASGINGILFFDEADALFGKRSDVSDSKDRYANMEVAYLLQRVEQFDGVTLLASNLRGNLDEAFTRRLDFVITYAEPTAEERRRLWEVHLPPTLPLGGDVDLDALAERFSLAGGEIANAARAAGHRAARADGVVVMRHLARAVADEYEKAGRLARREDFGPWADVLDA